MGFHLFVAVFLSLAQFSIYRRRTSEFFWLEKLKKKTDTVWKLSHEIKYNPVTYSTLTLFYIKFYSIDLLSSIPSRGGKIISRSSELYAEPHKKLQQVCSERHNCCLHLVKYSMCTTPLFLFHSKSCFIALINFFCST